MCPGQVTDTIDNVLGGSVVNLIVHPGGWVVVTLVIASVILKKYFSFWASSKIKAAGGGVTTQNPIADGGGDVSAPKVNATQPVHAQVGPAS